MRFDRTSLPGTNSLIKVLPHQRSKRTQPGLRVCVVGIFSNPFVKEDLRRPNVVDCTDRQGSLGRNNARPPSASLPPTKVVREPRLNAFYRRLAMEREIDPLVSLLVMIRSLAFFRRSYHLPTASFLAIVSRRAFVEDRLIMSMYYLWKKLD